MQWVKCHGIMDELLRITYNVKVNETIVISKTFYVGKKSFITIAWNMKHDYFLTKWMFNVLNFISFTKLMYCCCNKTYFLFCTNYNNLAFAFSFAFAQTNERWNNNTTLSTSFWFFFFFFVFFNINSIKLTYQTLC